MADENQKQTIRTALRMLSFDNKPQEQFQILERIGKGSFGAVYKALHWSSGTVVAIKKCTTEDLEESEQEVTMMKGIDCWEIIRWYGCYMYDNFLWIVMEYCALGALTDVLTLTGRNVLNEEQSASMCKAMLKALAYLHSTGKMHRDLKPENILLTENGDPKLADFGVAGAFGPDNKRTTLTGTPYYIAPEILEEDCIGYDETADIWSLGICSIEFAQGEPPNFHIPPMRVMLFIANNPPPTFKQPDKVSPAYLDFVKSALVKDPKKRPSAKQLLEHAFVKDAPLCTDTLKEVCKQAKEIIDKQGGIEVALANLKKSKTATKKQSDSESDDDGGSDSDRSGHESHSSDDESAPPASVAAVKPVASAPTPIVAKPIVEEAPKSTPAPAPAPAAVVEAPKPPTTPAAATASASSTTTGTLTSSNTSSSAPRPSTPTQPQTTTPVASTPSGSRISMNLSSSGGANNSSSSSSSSSTPTTAPRKDSKSTLPTGLALGNGKGSISDKKNKDKDKDKDKNKSGILSKIFGGPKKEKKDDDEMNKKIMSALFNE